MVGALRTEGRSMRWCWLGGRGTVGGTVDRGLGPEVGVWMRRAGVSGAVGRAAAVGLEAVGRLWLELQWLPPLSGEELLCEAGAGGPRLLYAPGGPGSPIS